MKTAQFITISLFLLIGLGLSAQKANTKRAKVTGIVLDEHKFPIPKAYVFIDSLKTGLRTNNKGVYKVRVLSDTKFVSVWHEEYGFKSSDYRGEKQMNFDFEKDEIRMSENDLEEQGYILNPEVYRQIGKKNYSQYLSMTQLIREEFTGVVVRANGSIQVRGSAQLNGGNAQPLFIVDGNYVNNLGSVIPEQVKSIELLKGEETALYGARGANGVFIIELLK